MCPDDVTICDCSFIVVLFLILLIERFSFECRKVIGFAIVTRSHAFSRALRQPHVITSSFDWFNVLSVSYVIGQSNFGFGFSNENHSNEGNIYWTNLT